MNISALRSGNFRLYLSGNIFATNALWMLRVIVGWIAWDLTHYASFVGLIAFLYFAPTIIVGPLFGVLTDRVNLRRAAFITQSAFMSLALLLWILHLLDAMGAPQLVIYAAGVGLTGAAHSPIRMALAPRLVDKASVSSVVSIAAINFNLSRMTGPAIGGLTIAIFGIGPAIFLTALFYLPILVALTMIDVREPTGLRGTPPPFWRALREGIAQITGNTRIQLALILTAIVSFIVRGTLEILPVIADGTFNKGAAGLGMLTTAAGSGAVLAGVWFAVSPREEGPVRFMTAGIASILGLIATASLGFTASWTFAILLVAAMALCSSATGITCQIAIQSDIDDTVRGRVMSLWAVVSIGSSALGAAALGTLSDLIGHDQALLVGSCAAAVVVLMLAVRKRRI